jgi:hypothetical protein
MAAHSFLNRTVRRDWTILRAGDNIRILLVHSEHLDTRWMDALGITRRKLSWNSTAVSCGLKKTAFTHAVTAWMTRLPEGQASASVNSSLSGESVDSARLCSEFSSSISEVDKYLIVILFISPDPQKWVYDSCHLIIPQRVLYSLCTSTLWLVHRHGVVVQRLIMIWTVWGSNPGGDKIYLSRLGRPWHPSRLLYNGYLIISGEKAWR